MFNRVTIDYIARNDSSGDFSLYLVERGDWSDLKRRLNDLQERIYTSLDAVLDGQLASDYPDSKGKNVRVCAAFETNDIPPEALAMIKRLDEYVQMSPEYASAGIERGLVAGIRVISEKIKD